MAAKKLNRAVSVAELESIKYKDFDWDGEWLEFFGDIELAGVILLHGDSGNGKTSFALQLCKYLASKGVKTAYNSLEQGKSKSMRKQVRDAQIREAKGRFLLLNREPIADLKDRLRKKSSPDFIVIDSIQYTGMNYKEYRALKEEFADKKLFLLISHADGLKPSGSVAKSIFYDADVKGRVEGYRAFTLSRLGGGKPFDIWPEESRKYYQEDL